MFPLRLSAYVDPHIFLTDAEKAYLVGYHLATVSLLLIWLTDLQILGKFRALNERLTSRRIYWAMVWVIVFFAITRIPQGFQMFCYLVDWNKRGFEMATPALVGIGVGSMVQFTYCTAQMCYLAHITHNFRIRSKRKISECCYFRSIVYLIAVNTLDWVGVFLYLHYVLSDGSYLLHNVFFAIIGFHSSTTPVTLHRLTMVALDRPTNMARLVSPPVTQTIQDSLETRKDLMDTKVVSLLETKVISKTTLS
jgi:hypothetical protein